ncbi:protein kinase-like protein [Paramyrothecium foliicola]|nr:protein kinase-like protein [Paramyrothecium foliicola]
MLRQAKSLFNILTSKIEDWVLHIRMLCGRKIMYHDVRKIIQISRRQLIKGPCTHQELEAMRYTAAHTTVCLPQIIRVYDRGEKVFIIMEFIQGETLDKLWPAFTQNERQRVVAEIWESVCQLHMCQPPSEIGQLIAGSITGGPVCEGALGVADDGAREIGPFTEAEEFLSVLKKSPNLIQDQLYPERVGFVYGDLALRNIIMKDDGHLCFLDWESAGWWPLYWECVKWYFNDFM